MTVFVSIRSFAYLRKTETANNTNDMWIFIELVLALLLLPVVVKWRDWGWWSCLTFIALCLLFTPLGGLLIYRFLKG